MPIPVAVGCVRGVFAKVGAPSSCCPIVVPILGATFGGVVVADVMVVLVLATVVVGFVATAAPSPLGVGSGVVVQASQLGSQSPRGAQSPCRVIAAVA